MRQTIQGIEEQLYHIPMYGKKVGLANIQRLINEMNKEIELLDFLNKTPIIHVTGTNGKGSVCKMLSNIYEKAGYQVGLFTSPHIDHITERIQINNMNVEEALFIEAYKTIKKICFRLNREGVFPTFFEWIFGICLYCFCRRQCNFLIIEVGIGGRLDTTNVLPRKDLCILTPIGMDHQNLLGDTIESIASEKSGIITKDCQVVLFNDQVSVTSIVEEVCENKHANCWNVLPIEKKIHHLSQLGIDFSIYNKYYEYDNLHLSSLSEYQIDNASIVLTAIEALRATYPVLDEHVVSSFASFYWPGRCELLSDSLLIDGAHNYMGAIMLVKVLRQVFIGKTLHLLIGMKEGKNVRDVVEVLCSAQIFQSVHVVDLTTTKSVDKKVLYDMISALHSHVMEIEDLTCFLKNYPYTQDSVLIGAGSLYLVSEIRRAYRLCFPKEEKND